MSPCCSRCCEDPCSCPGPQGAQGEKGDPGATGPTGTPGALFRSFAGSVTGIIGARYLADGGAGVNASPTPNGYPVGTSDVPLRSMSVNLLNGNTIPADGHLTVALVFRQMNAGAETVLYTTTYASGQAGVRHIVSGTPIPGGDQNSYDLRVTTDFDDTEVVLVIAATLRT